MCVKPLAASRLGILVKITSCSVLNLRIHNTGVVSSNPAPATIKAPLVRKATGNHLMNSTSLENLRTLSLVSATLEIELATQF